MYEISLAALVLHHLQEEEVKKAVTIFGAVIRKFVLEL